MISASDLATVVTAVIVGLVVLITIVGVLWLVNKRGKVIPTDDRERSTKSTQQNPTTPPQTPAPATAPATALQTRAQLATAALNARGSSVHSSARAKERFGLVWALFILFLVILGFTMEGGAFVRWVVMPFVDAGNTFRMQMIAYEDHRHAAAAAQQEASVASTSDNSSAASSADSSAVAENGWFTMYAPPASLNICSTPITYPSGMKVEDQEDLAALDIVVKYHDSTTDQWDYQSPDTDWANIDGECYIRNADDGQNVHYKFVPKSTS